MQQIIAFTFSVGKKFQFLLCVFQNKEAEKSQSERRQIMKHGDVEHILRVHIRRI